MTKITYPAFLRFFYASLWCVLLPLAVLYLLLRSIKQPAYRHFFSERFACYANSSNQPIWLHAASLGEIHAAAELLRSLRAEHPDVPLLISCQTPAGRQSAQALQLADSLCVYLPFDLAWTTRRFIKHFQPRLALIFETEIWPNLFLTAKQSGISLLMINARITERSLKGYARLGSLFPHAVSLVDSIACQNHEDAKRFITLGAAAGHVSVSGNIKWDRMPDGASVQAAQQQRSTWPQQPIWLAASTHPDEEPMVLSAHQEILRRWPNALLIWAPRHSERFQQVARAAVAGNFTLSTRSLDGAPLPQAQIFLIDTHGELLNFMPCADAVFVGGSLQNIGGHNVLEPAALGLPILVGPHTQHFAGIVDALKNADAIIDVPDAASLTAQLAHLLESPERAATLGQNALHCVQQSQGALQKTKADRKSVV